jgi:segregation and condensation protein A
VHSRPELIVTFLALLEMIRLKLIRVFQSGSFGPIRVYKRARPADAPHPLLDPETEYEKHHPHATNEERRATNDEHPTTNDERRATNDEPPTTNHERQTTTDEHSATSEERPNHERTNDER